MGKPTEKQGAKPTRKPTTNRAPLSPNGYVVAVLRLRDAAPARETRLLERVPQEFRADAQAMLARLDAK